MAACQAQFGCTGARHIRHIRSNPVGFVSQFSVLRVLAACQAQFGCAIARHSHHNRSNAVGFVRQFSVGMRLPWSPCNWILGSFGSFPSLGKCRGARPLGLWVTLKIRSTSSNHASMWTPFSWGWVPPLRHDRSFGSSFGSFRTPATSPSAIHIACTHVDLVHRRRTSAYVIVSLVSQAGSEEREFL